VVAVSLGSGNGFSTGIDPFSDDQHLTLLFRYKLSRTEA